MPKQFKRRNFLIDKEYQGKYILTYFLMAFGGCILFILFFVVLSSGTLSVAYDNYELQVGKTPLILFKELLKAHWLFLIISSFVIVIITTFITHRVAGPLFALNRYITQMCKGRIGGRLNLRKKDEAKKLARSLNQLNTLLTTKFKHLQDLTDNMDNKLTSVQESLGDKSDTHLAISEQVGALRDLNTKVKKEISFFKIDTS